MNILKVKVFLCAALLLIAPFKAENTALNMGSRINVDFNKLINDIRNMDAHLSNTSKDENFDSNADDPNSGPVAIYWFFPQNSVQQPIRIILNRKKISFFEKLKEIGFSNWKKISESGTYSRLLTYANNDLETSILLSSTMKHLFCTIGNIVNADGDNEITDRFKSFKSTDNLATDLVFAMLNQLIKSNKSISLKDVESNIKSTSTTSQLIELIQKKISSYSISRVTIDGEDYKCVRYL